MVEGARLERVYAGNRIEGSNPSPSARFTLQIFYPSQRETADCAERPSFGRKAVDRPTATLRMDVL